MRIRRTFLSGVLLGLCVALFVGTLKAAEEKAAVSSSQALQMLKDGNDRYAADKAEPKDIGQKRRTELVAGQHPFAVVVTCGDSRVPPEILFNQGLGDIFVLRVAGNVVEPYILGSIEYAVEHLHAPLVVVLGHDHCGAIAAALGPEKPTGNLGTLINDVYVGKQLPTSPDAAKLAAVKNNVLHQVEQITGRSDVMQEAVKDKKVQIISAIYHLETGKVEWLEK
jgi:carbonic anhydrase